MNRDRRGLKSGRLLLPVLVIALLLPPLFAQEVGRIDYLEGIVDIHREGEIVELFPSDIGFTLEAVDTITTGEDGRVEFSLTRLATAGTSISVGPDTAFRIESTLDPAGTKTRLEIFSGSLSLKVAKLSGRETLTVRSESAAMGVRGTAFEVVTAPDGGVLVLCDEGRVSCTDLNQQEVLAYAGQAVEKVPGDTISPLDVDPDEFDAYKAAWRETRLEIFRSGAPIFLKAYARQYRRVEPRFLEAYRGLAGYETRLKSYVDRARSGDTPSRSEIVRFRAEISPDLTRMRSILPFYRQTFFRLDELAGWALDRGLAQGVEFEDGSAAGFFQGFRRSIRTRREQIARVEHWFKLYTEMSRSSGDDPFGGESLMDDFFAPDQGSLLEEF